MTLGVDTSVIIAAVHANHPVHLSSSRWLDAAFDTHDVVVAHHSVLEAYAVLTRLPAQFRVGPDEEVWAYGSRVTGRSHDGSDLDLVLRAPGLQRIPAAALADLADSIRESTIPFLVETHDWARLPQQFHREIERSHVVLFGTCKPDHAGQRPSPQTPKPAANPAGQRSDDSKPTGSSAPSKD